MAGDIIQIYGDSIGIPLSVARHFTSYTMIAMLIGYLLSILLIPKYLKQDNALKISAVLGVIFSLGAIFTQGYTSVLFIALFGFAIAAMWSVISPFVFF